MKKIQESKFCSECGKKTLHVGDSPNQFALAFFLAPFTFGLSLIAWILGCMLGLQRGKPKFWICQICGTKNK